MLSWNVDAFLASARRDMFFVPIAISYERLVEEGAMMGELEGEAKQTESMWGALIGVVPGGCDVMNRCVDVG